MPAPTVAADHDAPALDDVDAQIDCFTRNSFVVLPGLLPPELVARLNAAIDRDRAAFPNLWWWMGSPNNAGNLLLTEPVFDEALLLPPVTRLLDRLMGGPWTFEEMSVQVTEPGPGAPTGWHRDRPYWPQHPHRLDFPQVIAYLTDVDDATHCFTLSPEPSAGPAIDDPARQVAERGTVYLHARAGSAVFFNCAAVHGLTRRDTDRQRRILQIYYGHADRPELSQVSVVPPRLWRDHPDPDVRRRFAKHNALSRAVHAGMGIEVV